MKDDKHFPYVRVDFKKDYPRVEVVRKVKTDSARYFGPYLSGIALREALLVVREHFPVRHCKKDISRAIARRERPCLMYQLGKCSAPCSGNVSKEEYHALMHSVCDFLSGKTQSVLSRLEAEMVEAAESLAFEKAALIRDRISAIKSISEKQIAIAANGVDHDVLALCTLDNETLVFALFVRGGKVVGTEQFALDGMDGSTEDEAMDAFLLQYYGEKNEIPREILLYNDTSDIAAISQWLTQKRSRSVNVVIPKRGEKRRLTELAYNNGMEKLTQSATLRQRSWERGEGALAALAGALGLVEIPSRMECFDNSHIQGRDTVSSMVVFIDGKAAPKEYRRFRLRTETNGDDYAAMREALTRRFERALENDAKFTSLPDLLVIDGGRGQLNVALAVMDETGFSHIPVIGLAEERDVVYLPDEKEPLFLKRNSPELYVLQRIRDEAHRFAITYHRTLRAKNALYSVLDDIDGIGDKRKRALFDTFLTIDAIKAADVEALTGAPGMSKTAAQSVFDYFHKSE